VLTPQRFDAVEKKNTGPKEKQPQILKNVKSRNPVISPHYLHIISQLYPWDIPISQSPGPDPT